MQENQADGHQHSRRNILNLFRSCSIRHCWKNNSHQKDQQQSLATSNENSELLNKSGSDYLSLSGNATRRNSELARTDRLKEEEPKKLLCGFRRLF